MPARREHAERCAPPGVQPHAAALRWRRSRGCVAQLRRLWAGGIAGYVVLVTAKDPDARPREIDTYRADVVFPIERLRVDADGTTLGLLGSPIPVEDLTEHAMRHPLAPTTSRPPS